MKIDLLVKFSVINELHGDTKIEKIADILLDEEKVELAYTHARDRVWFTNKRLITSDFTLSSSTTTFIKDKLCPIN
ncbi:PH domain-containing protein [uncultured Kordia sp.]|uniref:PH domain-containing protein n=1 Tax=uncultured Kordia sp. TaxID=507699 RepID=UPI00263A193A|nr:PH domain-containing protein [uncultured Kordia sp.]